MAYCVFSKKFTLSVIFRHMVFISMSIIIIIIIIISIIIIIITIIIRVFC